MIKTFWRRAAAAMAMGCGLLGAITWGQAQAAPVVFQKSSANGTSDLADRFTGVLAQGGNANQALLQLFTAPSPGSRIAALYLQDTAGAVAFDGISGYPMVQLSPTQIYEVVLNSPGPNQIAVIKALSGALGVTLSEAKALVDNAPAVIRTAMTPDGHAELKQSLESAGASVTLSSHPDPSLPAGTNAGVTAPGTSPTGYDVVLADAGGNKIPVIKAVRDLTGLSLTEAKKLVDDAPSVIRTNVSRADALDTRQQLQDSGAMVELKPVGPGSTGQGPFILPPNGTGFAPSIEVNFEYQDVSATPVLQLTLDLDTAFADLLAALDDGRFLLGLKVTDGAGLSDLYLTAQAPSPAQLPEPPTIALLSLPLLGLLLGRNARPSRAAALSRRRSPRCVGTRSRDTG